MTYRFSARSRSHLSGVSNRLVRVCVTALALTKIDFGIIDGLRTAEEQAELKRSGASKTLKSKHLNGHAIDLMAYVGRRGSWELELYCKIADAFVRAARREGVGVRWGGAWNVPDIRYYEGSMEDAMRRYIRERLDAGRTPFVDAGHFELTDEEIQFGEDDEESD